MDRVAGKVAFVTGAARGQGRSHAVRLAEEGADIIAVDICGQIASVPYGMATADDLAETVEQVERLGRRIVAAEVDVRDADSLTAVLDDGVAQLGGRLDIVAANAGVCTFGAVEELSNDDWLDVIGVNLTGVWNTCKAAIPHVRAGGRGGCIVIISSGVGLSGAANIGPYVAAKHGALGLMKTLTIELGPLGIRVNAICPGLVDTEMTQNDSIYSLFRPDLPNPGLEDAMVAFTSVNALPVPWMEPIDISNALLFLASDEARYVTGAALPVDAGCLAM